MSRIDVVGGRSHQLGVRLLLSSRSVSKDLFLASSGKASPLQASSAKASPAGVLSCLQSKSSSVASRLHSPTGQEIAVKDALVAHTPSDRLSTLGATVHRQRLLDMKIRGNDTAPSIWREDEKEVIRWKSYFSSIWREDEEKEAARTAGNILQQCVRTTHSSYTSEVLKLFNDTVRRRHDRADHEEGTHFPASAAGASGQPVGMSNECSEVSLLS